MSGYSNKTLLDKLGIKSGFIVYLSNVPKNYFKLLGEIPSDVIISKDIKKDVDFIHYFTKDRIELENNFKKFIRFISQKGMIWISWPKVSYPGLSQI